MRTKGELPTVGMRTYAGALGHGYSHFLRLPAVERHTPQLPELLSTLDPGVKDKSSVGTPSKAADFFGRACGRLDFEGDAFFFDPLARALYESGDLDKARKEYEKITLLTLGRLYHGDIYAKAFTCLERSPSSKGIRHMPAKTTANSSTSGKTPTPACPKSRTRRPAWPSSKGSNLRKKLGTPWGWW